MKQLKTNHAEELAELQSYGNNIKDFFYSVEKGEWVLQFKQGKDLNFEEKRDMLEFIYAGA